MGDEGRLEKAELCWCVVKCELVKYTFCGEQGCRAKSDEVMGFAPACLM